MRLGIVAWDCDEHESTQLAEVARVLGHDALLFTLDDVRWARTGSVHGVAVRERPVAELDVIVSRAQLRRERWQTDLEALTLLGGVPGTPILDPAAEFVAAESKFVQNQLLGRAGIPVLPTVACRSLEDVRDAIDAWGDVVLKPSFGMEGCDVERIRAGRGLTDVAGRLLGRYGALLAQPYVPHPEGDVRLTVVGGEVVLTFRRVPQGEGWKANLAQGARAEPLTPSSELVDLALRACSAMSITIAGVDVMRHGDGHVVVEINNGPGWHPLTDQQEWTVASAIVRYAECVAAEAAG